MALPGAGHRKAVSYVRYLNSEEVVSASTDSTLRLWNTRSLQQTRRFSGHVNEKNFVGLSVDSEFIACGSETDEVQPQRTFLITAWPPIMCTMAASAGPWQHHIIAV